jgi:radical SAM protein with 4Fe4S-binding SPASM domain
VKELKGEVKLPVGSQAELKPEAPYSFFVQWHLTERCNLRCRHCYQGETASEMSREEIVGAVNEVKATIDGWRTAYDLEITPAIHFTGGEPLLRRDIFTILDHARSLGFSLSLLSNGTLITEETARRIGQAGVSDVQVSLEGLEDVHDSIRGRGSFRAAVRGIKNLVAQGIDTNINITVSRVNADQIEGLADLAVGLGAGAVTFSRLVPCGRGGALAGEMLTPSELAGLYDRARGIGASYGITVSSLDPLFTLAGIKEEVPQLDFPVGGCSAGLYGLTIASDGCVMPCRRMDVVIGNIREQSLRELWAESPVLWALRTRREYHGGCESCYYWAVCRGCRAIALASARLGGREDFLGADPQCPYRREVETR